MFQLATLVIAFLWRSMHLVSDSPTVTLSLAFLDCLRSRFNAILFGMNTTLIITHLSALLMGVAIGWFGTYMADKSTDLRRSKEKKNAEDAAWRDVCAKMPELIKEMQEDWRKPDNQMIR